MLWRFFTFLIFQTAGAIIGWMQPGPFRPTLGALFGVVGGGVLWLLIDVSRGARLLRWLRLGATSEVAMRTGMWGELSDRVRRLVRSREQLTLESQGRLQDFLAAFQASPNGVVMLDSHGQIEWFNQIAANHFGLDSERDKLQHFGNLVRDPGFASYFSSQNYSTELVMPGRQSTPSRPVKLSVQLHPYGEGRLLLLSRDVTALEQAEAMRRDFVANVSHEIRTPLTVLSGFVETLQTLPLDEEERVRYLALMALQAERMQTLVSDLLTLSRLEGSPPPGGSEWIQVASLAADLEQEGRSLSAALHGSADCVHDLVFETSFLGDLAGSRNELRSAMSNLVGNAIRYTAAGGKIRVRTTVLADGKGEFSVTDSGPGIAEEHIPRLTERFYRVDRSRSRDTGGTGLGLAIVKHVAQRHGAELKIESQLGVGSTFSVVFPASRMRKPSA
jgi:two-component system, OmpR family, phosphate regulon sensor histidine kinase PhoR